jgi:hypothetical protein
MAVKFDVAFIPQLQAIAKDATAISKFQKIEKTHELQFNVKIALLATGVALAVLAMTVLKETRFTTGTLLLGAACVIKAVLPTQVRTQEYTARLQEINDLFEPAINGLTRAYEAKKTAIAGVVTGIEAEDLPAASKTVKAAVTAFDNGTKFSGKKIENPIEVAGKGSYASIEEAAQKMASIKLADESNGPLFAKLDPSVKTAMEKLQAAARQFLLGDQVALAEGISVEPGKDAYVRYNVVEGKIAVV